MKKFLFITPLFFLIYYTGFYNRSGTYRQLVNNTGKIDFTESTIVYRPFLFGKSFNSYNVKKAGIEEIVSMEGDIYGLFNCAIVNGN